MSDKSRENERIIREYDRRRREIPSDRYAIWNPSALHTRFSRERAAIGMLHGAGVFPRAESRCLEVGYGSLGWLGTLVSWGVREEMLCGMELDPERAATASSILPKADLRVGDASELPFDGCSVDLVVVSTVFTSVLDGAMRTAIAGEIERVIKPGGALLYYDFAFDNPKNPNVRGIKKREVRRLFQELEGDIRKITLAPPISRLVCPLSTIFADLLEKCPLLRTHLIAVLVKKGA